MPEEYNEYPDRDPSMEMAEYLAARLQEMKQRILAAEALLERNVANDMVEILTDPEGNFTYRLTAKGKKTYVEKTGLPAPTTDISFHEMY